MPSRSLNKNNSDGRGWLGRPQLPHALRGLWRSISSRMGTGCGSAHPSTASRDFRGLSKMDVMPGSPFFSLLDHSVCKCGFHDKSLIHGSLLLFPPFYFELCVAGKGH